MLPDFLQQISHPQPSAAIQMRAQTSGKYIIFSDRVMMMRLKIVVVLISDTLEFHEISEL